MQRCREDLSAQSEWTAPLFDVLELRRPGSSSDRRVRGRILRGACSLHGGGRLHKEEKEAEERDYTNQESGQDQPIEFSPIHKQHLLNWDAILYIELPVRTHEREKQVMKSTGILVMLLLLSTAVTCAERRRDPLTQAEAEQLRAVAGHPYKRLNLYVKFTKARLDSIDQLRSDPKSAEGRGRKIHDLLEDFTAIMDEINDALDQYAGRPLSESDKKDFDKGLREVIEASDKFDLKLRTLQSAKEADPQAKKEAADYQFVLQDAQEALKSTADMAREYLTEKDSNQKK